MDHHNLLQALSSKMLADKEVADNVSDEIRQSGWLGYLGCSDDQIAKAEQRLGVELPTSLRQFYRITNGWRDFNSFVYSILPIEKIDYLHVLDSDLAAVVKEAEPIPGDPEYYEEQVASVLRSIVLSTDGDATTTLIDPQSDVGNGEWNVGAWASWHPAMEWSNTDWWSYVASQGPT